MSREGAESYTKEKESRELRRSKRNKKAARLVDSGSETETEDPIALGWDVGNLLGDKESEQEGSEYSFGEFSNTAHHNYIFEREKEKVERKPKVVEKVIEFTKGREDESVMSKETRDSGRGATPEAGLNDFMRLYIDEQRRRDERREQERREEMDRWEEKRREEREQRERERAEARDREERLWHRILIKSNPFEAALQRKKVPRDEWREQLVSHIPIDLLMKVKSQVDDEDESYEDLVGALSNSSTLTFCAAAEDLCTGERGRVWELDGRKAAAKVKALLGQVTRYADTKPDLIDCIRWP